MKNLTIFLFSSGVLFSILTTSTAVDTIAVNQTVRDGDTIVSAGGTFALGFFSPGNSTNRYVGMWYNRISTTTVVWVANRDTPLKNTSGVLTLNGEGILMLRNPTNSTICSSNSSGSVRNPVAKLLDNGNLVIGNSGDNNPENFIWQSFDYPTDTNLPGMKFGKDLVTGIERYMPSWKSVDDPSTGEYTAGMDIDGYPQVFQRRNSVIQYRIGPWNGVRWSGLPGLGSNQIFAYEFVFNQREIYHKYELINTSVVGRYFLTPDGNVYQMTWIDRTKEWFLFFTPTIDSCDRYGVCGPYGSCNIANSPVCECLKGFEPRHPEEWKIADWSRGCRYSIALDCRKGDGFRKYSGLKLPDTRQARYNQSMNLEECEKACLNDCNCTAYSNLDIRRGGSGCLLWFSDLIDIREISGGQDLYVKMATSEIEKDGSSSVNRRTIIIVISVLLAAITVLGILRRQVFKRRKLARKAIKRKRANRGALVHQGRPFLKRNQIQDSRQDYGNEIQDENFELPLFSVSTLLIATNNFSINHKLGEGGFGPVYKGKLLTGQEIAVKRLSNNSGQGHQEFKNEILLISRLQHRNLVRIMGCCVEGEERMPVYECLPNKSLDYFIFDKDHRVLLTWENCFEIALGIAKGLLYLHHDSRLRIIHRDLKASNVLLDSELNPKISDFGIARIFGGDQSEGKTKHVIGTYGYMSPEYAIHGKFSVKSDVFSFGVLLIEMLSGKKNTKYRHPSHHHSLLGHAWLLWNEGKALELVDKCLEDSGVKSQVLRFIQVGLLCVQRFPKDRPTMSSVILMLSNEGVTLPQPRQSGFFAEKNSSEEDIAVDEENCLSRNVVTITTLEAR